MHFYEPVGICIYCGDTHSKLTDEHIIPFGLAGEHVLPQASCKTCAKITGRFEGVVLRSVLGDLRMRNNFPTRRPHERPKMRRINTITGPKFVPTSEFPAIYVNYNFEQAGIIVGAPKELRILHKVPTIIADRSQDEFKNKHGWDGVVGFKFMPDEFRRLLLKIGYGYAIAHLGYGSFRPFSIPYFMNDGENLSYLVGQNSKQEEMDNQFLHKTKLNISLFSDGIWRVVLEIRLFAGAMTPTYLAVLGDFESQAQLKTVLARLSGRSDIEVSIGCL